LRKGGEEKSKKRAREESPSHGDGNHEIYDQPDSTPRDREAVELSIGTGMRSWVETIKSLTLEKGGDQNLTKRARTSESPHGDSNHEVFDKLISTPQDREAVELSIGMGNENLG
jgi:hypothetical protein